MTRYRTARYLIIASLVALARCSGPSGAGVDTGVDSEPAVPAVQMGRYVWLDTEALGLFDRASGQTTELGGGGNAVWYKASPGGDYAALALEVVSGTKLLMVDVEGRTVRVIHEGGRNLVYTGTWGPDGHTFVFGYYAPGVVNDRPALGSGDIRAVSLPVGDVRSIGCSASRAVIAWPSADVLLVRSTDQLYRVSPGDCSTIGGVDIRRWHGITASPDGQSLAYIFRELSYNRETRQYEPDSALYVVDYTGGEPVKVVGDRFRPRHLAWSADSREIAFDVRVNPDSGQRAVSVYSLDTGETVYLTAPTAGAASRTHPIWSGSDSSVSFVEGGTRLLIRAPGAVFDRPIELPAGARRMLAWPAGRTAYVEDAEGAVWIYDIENRAAARLGKGTVIALASSG